MKCFRCGSSVVGDAAGCSECGQSLTEYRKAIWASNVYYNNGLERAKANDLSGAAAVLKKSLALNKMNTDARNLLGLVYYQMGEVADAAREWFISRGLQFNDNEAAYYISELRAHRGKFDYFITAAQKLNQAVEYAKQGNKDVALLQAKKVINMNPNYVKAYLLLALLYIEKGEDVKADKTLKRVLKIDCLNSTALRYQEELGSEESKRIFAALKLKKKEKPEDDPFDDSHTLDEPIIPTYTEISDNWHAVALLLFGLIAGALFFTYLILPNAKTSLQDEFNRSIVTYNENISAKDGEITSLHNRIDSMEKEINNLKEELDAYSDDSGILASYNRLLDVMQMYYDDDYIGALYLFSEIDASIVTNEKFQEYYEVFNEEFTVNGVSKAFDTGVSLYDAGDFEGACEYFEICVALQPDFPDALFRLGAAYVGLGDQEAANQYFTQVIENYPGTSLASQAMVMMGEQDEE